MNLEQLTRGNKISSKLTQLYREKQAWEIAVKLDNNTKLVDNKSTFVYIDNSCMFAYLTEEQFKMLRYMKLQQLDQQIAKLETEFQNL